VIHPTAARAQKINTEFVKLNCARKSGKNLNWPV
jgi:hypothetical protein